MRCEVCGYLFDRVAVLAAGMFVMVPSPVPRWPDRSRVSVRCPECWHRSALVTELAPRLGLTEIA